MTYEGTPRGWVAHVDFRINDERMTLWEPWQELLEKLVDNLGVTPMSYPCIVPFNDYKGTKAGVSAFRVIAESHFAMHTYPECNVAWLDMVSCKEFTEEDIRDTIREVFPESEIIKCTYFER